MAAIRAADHRSQHTSELPARRKFHPKPRAVDEVTLAVIDPETSNVIDSGFVCENPDCDAFREVVES